MNATLVDAHVYQSLAAHWRRVGTKYAAEGMQSCADYCETVARAWDNYANEAHKAAVEVVPDRRVAYA